MVLEHLWHGLNLSDCWSSCIRTHRSYLPADSTMHHDVGSFGRNESSRSLYQACSVDRVCSSMLDVLLLHPSYTANESESHCFVSCGGLRAMPSYRFSFPLSTSWAFRESLADNGYLWRISDVTIHGTDCKCLYSLLCPSYLADEPT